MVGLNDAEFTSRLHPFLKYLSGFRKVRDHWSTYEIFQSGLSFFMYHAGHGIFQGGLCWTVTPNAVPLHHPSHMQTFIAIAFISVKAHDDHLKGSGLSIEPTASTERDLICALKVKCWMAAYLMPSVTISASQDNRHVAGIFTFTHTGGEPRSSVVSQLLRSGSIAGVCSVFAGRGRTMRPFAEKGRMTGSWEESACLRRRLLLLHVSI